MCCYTVSIPEVNISKIKNCCSMFLEVYIQSTTLLDNTITIFQPRITGYAIISTRTLFETAKLYEYLKMFHTNVD